MDRTHGPTGAMLAGATFIYLCLMMTVLAADYDPDASGAIEEVTAYHSHFVHHSLTYDSGELRLSGGNFTFPWAKRLPQASVFRSFDFVLLSPPIKEEIILTGLNPGGQIDDYAAINSVKKRDLPCSATKDARYNGYGMRAIRDVGFICRGQALKAWMDENNDNDLKNIEGIVDARLRSCLSGGHRVSSDCRTSTLRRGNDMNIDISGISVHAMNTVPGGKAMATSNIVIKPVQILICPSEVEEKLK